MEGQRPGEGGQRRVEPILVDQHDRSPGFNDRLELLRSAAGRVTALGRIRVLAGEGLRGHGIPDKRATIVPTATRSDVHHE